ncbi:glycosyltransferase family 9 protein [Thalassospiraceae bacterium LMO-JJ14]|nr:glycosyltransferase family 9 protein [Thalassospiraceae bacterium LMO-JJ14]
MRKPVHNPESVLIHVGLDRLGDGLLKLPFVRGLRTAFPSANLTWFAGKETSVYGSMLAPLATNHLDEIIEYGGIGFSPKELLQPRPLAERRFDLVIDTQRNFSTALAVRRIRHTHFISPAAKFLLSSIKPRKDYKFPKAMQRQMLDLLEIASGQSFATPAKLDLNIPVQYTSDAASLLPDGKRYIGFAPGSGGRPKCWPLDRFIAAACDVRDAGYTPVFLIGPQEEEWAEDIRRDVPEAILPLQEGQGAADHNYDPLLTIALGTRMTAAVSNDSGIAHMLAVAGAPLIALYGPTVYEKFPPMTDDIAVIRAEAFGSREMSAIPVDAVTDALRGRLAAVPAS